MADYGVLQSFGTGLIAHMDAHKPVNEATVVANLSPVLTGTGQCDMPAHQTLLPSPTCGYNPKNGIASGIPQPSAGSPGDCQCSSGRGSTCWGACCPCMSMAAASRMTSDIKCRLFPCR